MRWRKTDKEVRLARQIVETKLDRLVPKRDGWMERPARAESVEEYLRRGGKVVKLPPR